MRRPLVLACLSALAVAALGIQPSNAAAAPLVLTDPAGDALDAQPSNDIVSLTFDVKTLPRQSKPSLVVAMKLSASPGTQLVQYGVYSQIPGCGFLEASFRPGTVYQRATGFSPTTFFLECGKEGGTTGNSELMWVPTRVEGSTVTFAIAMDSLSKKALKGGKLTSIRGFTSYAEPVLGIHGNGYTDMSGTPAGEGLPTDELRTDKQFSLA